MGKWASYRKRGSAAQHGFLQAPQIGDWTVGAPTATTLTITRVAAIPGGASSMGILTVNVLTGNFVSLTGPTASTPFNVTGLTPATAYRLQAAWFSGTLRISDWSAPLLGTTTA